MPTPSSPDLIYPSEEAAATLFRNINEKNSTNLNYQDFDFGIPEAVTVAGRPTINTKVKVISKNSSLLYGEKEFYYKRMNLAEVLAAPVGLIVPGSNTLLSQIIPQINNIFGIGLRADDYVEKTIPAFDPANAGIVRRVIVEAKPESLLFYGSFNLAIGPVAPDVEISDPSIVHYIHVEGYNPSDYAKTIQAIDKNGLPSTDFSFLHNCAAIGAFDVDRLIVRNDGDLILNGTFDLIYTNDDEPTEITAAHSLIIRPDGGVRSHGSSELFNATPATKYYEHPAVPYKYCVDLAITTRPNRIYRYDQDGAIDSSYNPSSITYVPALLAVSPDGKLYTASPVFTADIAGVPTKQVNIHRLHSNGTVDETFTPVVITAQGGSEIPASVVQIMPFTDNGFWMLILPLYGVGITAQSPVVNGVALVPGGITTAMAWNPVVRISNTGVYITTFKSVLKDNLENSVFMYNGSGVDNRQNLMFGDNLTPGFLTYKDNPITGFRHKQPIKFSDIGNPVILSGTMYYEQFRWTVANNVIPLPTGEFIVYGKTLIKDPAGGWQATQKFAIGKYAADGSPISLIWQSALLGMSAETLNLASVATRVVPSVEL